MRQKSTYSAATSSMSGWCVRAITHLSPSPFLSSFSSSFSSLPFYPLPSFLSIPVIYFLPNFLFFPSFIFPPRPFLPFLAFLFPLPMCSSAVFSSSHISFLSFAHLCPHHHLHFLSFPLIFCPLSFLLTPIGPFSFHSSPRLFLFPTPFLSRYKEGTMK